MVVEAEKMQAWRKILQEKKEELDLQYTRIARSELINYFLEISKKENFPDILYSFLAEGLLISFVPKDLLLKVVSKLKYNPIRKLFLEDKPSEFYVYRGCSREEWESHDYGVWWTDDPDYASMYSNYYSYFNNGVILRFKIKKEKILYILINEIIIDVPADAKVDIISYDDFTNHNTWRYKGKIFDYPPHKF